MIHNFNTEIEELKCNKAVKDFLKRLYDEEEKNKSVPSDVVSQIYYENLTEEYYRKLLNEKI